ncbi:gamma-glutamyl-gamma-aminobutyrate hydrolase [Lentilactobacillus fungorum]|uniref:Gamma-glutamyl-gamma-aminobutyrate hydrolase n=1 Tax=Lentilactobacillus fungorum TaxID=2201250 RepID=A0ABQ3W1J0_9LACO|nr:gamma-glutamyl-gamma-aminobutyrate hydrolase family protein [Lentilactobacillus fungorum]GHP13539.1 gamma-glutamyl-gamma-aminobutyrate hydrolase [Lentilactobacillus fungorum]
MDKQYVIGFPAETRIINNLARNVVNDDEVAGVVKHGGVPVLIPTRNPEIMEQYIDLVDGLLLPGGPDIAPKFYGEEPVQNLGDTDAFLDASEIALVKLAVAKRKPIFGICRGVQVLNVALGGTLYQDLYSQRDHLTFQHYQKAPMPQGTHTVSTTPDSYLAKIIGYDDSTLVNSHHHEAVKAISAQLNISALAKDGVIEGVESKDDDLIIGVQWHPEAMFRTDKLQDALFANFMSRVEKFANQKEKTADA